ncbi:MAG: SDR family oxidoreductase [Acidimicrobiales bacterium]|nr:SDR family oxidoreductase [Acidimicrobiales bacterium]MDG1845382.1 SDR family oxidoreductase [Acidimicrobiales bacterium]
MDLLLDGKSALITGGSKGIGKAIAKEFANAGAKVMITSRKAEVCEEAAIEIGNGCTWQAGNVGDLDHMEQAIVRTIEIHGGVDILVNNAATNPYAGPMIEADLPRWKKTLDVNMTAPFAWTQMVWKKYQKENGGVVLNIASVGGLETNPVLGVYDVSKAGLIHMTKQFAAELAPQVRVNAICPGLIKTDFARLLWEGDAGEMVAQAYPLKRLGEVEDIAAAALYLAAESGSWITGQTIVLDGGQQISF